MIHDDQENYALVTINMVHADWDTDVNPTQTGHSGPLPWSLGMAPGIGEVLSSVFRT